MIEWTEEAITFAKHAILAAVGGLVRELVKGGKHTLAGWIGGALVGVFTGFLVGLICGHYNVEPKMTWAMSGLGGYIGTPLLDLMGAIVKRFVRRNMIDPDKPPTTLK